MSHRFGRVAARVALAATIVLPTAAATGIVSSPPVSAASDRLSVTPTRAAAKEVLFASATLATGVRRPVRLQYLSSSRWKDLRSGRTTSSGRASFAVKLGRATLSLRVYAPKTKVGSRTYAARKTPTVVIRRVGQSAAVSLSEHPASGAMTASAVASPARAGRAVALQEHRGGSSWRTVATARQSTTGRVTFPAIAGTTAAGKAYRVQVAARNGAAAIASPYRRFTPVAKSISLAQPDPSLIDAEGRLALTASTTGAVERVRFFVDGRRVGSDDTAPGWGVSWKAERGEHDVMARAIGPSGSVISTTRTVTIPGTAIDDVQGLPEGFRLDTVQEGFDLPTSFATGPTGEIFVAQKAGTIVTFRKGEDGSYSEPRTVVDISDHVLQEQDRGMVGLAVDPRFGDDDGHRFIYATYILRDPNDLEDGRLDEVQQVQRFDVDEWSGQSADPLGYDADGVILGGTTGSACYAEANIRTPDCVPIHGFSHSIGDLAFDQDDNLLVGVGDGSLFYTDNGLDGRQQSLRAQDPDVIAGKVLRIDPDTGRGVPGNPAFGDPDHDGTDPADFGLSNASRVLAQGFRNPFRITVRDDGTVIVGDVGDAKREEINVIDPEDEELRNFGWPCFEGDDRTAVTVSTGPTPDPSTNPWDTCRLLWEDEDEPTEAPAYSYAHVNGGSITGGVVYTGESYPEEYRGAYFFGDYAQNFIRTARIDHHGAVGSVAPFAYKSAAGGPVKFAMGPDGTLWYLSIYTGSLRRLVYDPATPSDACQVGSFSTRYYDLADPATTLAKSPDDYPPGYGWLRMSEAAFPTEPEAVEPTCRTTISLDPTTGPLASDNPPDKVGVRWQGRLRLEAGTYEFDVEGKDWMRVSVDDAIIHEWFAYGGWLPRTGTVTVPAGLHNVRVELVHDTGEAFADVTWRRVGSPPAATITVPRNGAVLPGALEDGIQTGTASYSVSLASGVASADLESVTVLADLLHVTDDDLHAHPYAEKSFDLGGSSGVVTGSFGFADSHAPRHSVFRLRARVEDESGAVTTSAPVYVCLVGNAVGPCAVQ